MTTGHDGHSDDEVVVRPYLLTRGRTTATLPIEAIVSTIGAADSRSLFDDESRAIVTLCVTPSAVAEVSAHLRLPLGVARVLIADLVDAGWLSASDTAGDHPDVGLVERLIAGLRALA